MEQQVNLYQPILGAEKRLFSARAIGVAVLLFMLSLGLIAGIAGWQLRDAERTLAAIDARQASRQAATERGLASLRAGNSLQSLEDAAQRLSSEIADRERVLAAIRSGAVAASGGFSGQLLALGRRQVEGLWLRRIVLGSSGQRLALSGAASDAGLVADYLGALSQEPVLAGARFEHFVLRRPTASDGTAATLFEAGELPLVANAVREAP